MDFISFKTRAEKRVGAAVRAPDVESPYTTKAVDRRVYKYWFAKPGLNYGGKCLNEKCNVYKEMVCCHKGFGKHRPIEDAECDEIICPDPDCGEPFECLAYIICNCKCTIKYKKEKSKKVETIKNCVLNRDLWILGLKSDDNNNCNLSFVNDKYFVLIFDCQKLNIGDQFPYIQDNIDMLKIRKKGELSCCYILKNKHPQLIVFKNKKPIENNARSLVTRIDLVYDIISDKNGNETKQIIIRFEKKLFGDLITSQQEIEKFKQCKISKLTKVTLMEILEFCVSYQSKHSIYSTDSNNCRRFMIKLSSFIGISFDNKMPFHDLQVSRKK